MKFYEDEEYTRMCEKAEEIQKIWKSHYRQEGYSVEDEPIIRNCYVKDGLIGSFWYDKGESYTKHGITDYPFATYGVITNFSDFNSPPYSEFIWLPRQDQLQEMVKGDFIELCDYISQYTERFVELKTPEKILLKIVMKENYNKTWEGESWVDWEGDATKKQ